MRLYPAGQRFGRLVVRGRGARTNYLVCLCNCGNHTEVRSDHLRTGKIQSCGCQRLENSAAAKRKHGHALWSGHSPEYGAWNHMRSRCYYTKDVRFNSYGARGIKVCPEWRYDFSAFFAYVGTRPSPDHSIDRIDVNRDYEPGNVRWATRQQQASNRTTNRAFRNLDGERLTLSEIARYLGIKSSALNYRLVRAGVLS